MERGKVMVDVTSQKCACPDCVCVVPIKEAIQKDGRNFCSDACATGHGAGAGCGHGGCGCKG